MPAQRFIAATTRVEHHLLLLLSRTRMNEALDAEVSRLIAENPVNWDDFVRVAAEHGVLSLCYRHLQRVVPHALPASTTAQIQASAMTTAMHNLELTKELTHLKNMLTDAHVDVLTYKGPSLAMLAYGGVGYRQFLDLDLLVSSQQLMATKNLILAHNYYAYSSPEHRDQQKEDHDRSYQGYDLIRKDNRVVVDLQERFGLRYSSFRLSFEELWSRHQLIQFGDRKVAVPALGDYLLVLCAHGTQHRWYRLKWICDIAELVQSSPDLNWEVVFERAEAMQVQRMVHIALLLAHEALDMPLPEVIRARLFADKSAYSMALNVYKWIFKESKGFMGLVQRARFDYSFDLTVRQNLSDQLACIVFLTRRRLFPRREHNKD